MTQRSEATIPSKMKAVIATGFGDIEQNIHFRNDWVVPKLEDPFSSNREAKERTLLIRVLATALAPGDVRILSGKTDYVQLPSEGHPYVPGSDSCGIVAQVQPGETKFRVGDRVVARFDEPKPVGGLAEYRIVKTSLSEQAPVNLTPVQACGLPASAAAAKRVVKLYLNKGDRVLILGGSGGVGTMLCQYAKAAGASYVASTSTQRKLLQSLGVDRVIDYRTTNWWEVPEFQQSDQKFDVVFDLVNGMNWVRGGCSGNVIRPAGIYVALLSGVATEIEVHGMLDMIRLMFQFLGRTLYSRLCPGIPKWVAPEALALQEGDLKELFEDFESGTIRPVLDPASPFSFDEQGVRDSFALQKSTHAHGKVVVEISSAAP